MNIHKRLKAFWSGERPDQIPYTIYYNEWRHIADDPAWQAMYEAGLGVVWGCSTVRSKRSNVEWSDDSYKENGHQIRRRTMRTPIGNIYTTSVDGWRQKYWLETAEDYRVMTYIVEHTDLIPKL